MAKILSRAGASLADVYDVKGSIAGIEDLRSEEVHLTHEMGATIHQERMVAQVLNLSSGAILQSVTFNVNFSFQQTARILALQCISTNGARLTRGQVSITSAPAADNTDVPIWSWDTAVDGTRVIQVMEAGTVTSRTLLRPIDQTQVPNILIGNDSARPASTISIRGISAAFGAGTVTFQALVLVAFAATGGISSRGLPMPSW